MPKPKLKYIVLSDLHLGEEGSLFTSKDPDNFNLINSLGECLKDLIDQLETDEFPKLILNGDILGLSFSGYEESLSIFKEFVETVSKKNKVCDQIIYIPGNHDHHIWSLAKENHFIKKLGKRKIEDPIPKMINVTEPLLENGFETTFFDSFLSPIGIDDLNIKVFYPNFLIKPTESDGNAVMFTHGHFAEKTYHFTTIAMRSFYPDLEIPPDLQHLEDDNGSWIDFAFSELGRSGKAGGKFSDLIATLSDKKALDQKVDYLATNLAKSINFPYLPFQFMEKMLSKTILKKIGIRFRNERYRGNVLCSDDTMEGLMDYLNNYCYEIVQQYVKVKNNATLVWSHTHKPFQKITETEKFGKLKIVNTGGWVIPPSPTPLIGASIILIDDKNQVQSLRIYNDSQDGGTMHFKVLLKDNEKQSKFCDIINNVLYHGGKLKKPWSDFRHLIEQEINKRRNENRTQ